MSALTLLDRQQALGGVLAESTDTAPHTLQFCCPRVRHFGNARAEYLAVQAGVGVFDVSDRRQIELTGRDCRSFLHNYCTNDIKRLKSGHGCEALITNIQGRILAHIFVFATEVSVWIEAGPGDDAALVGHFERYVFNADVQLRARTAQYGELLLAGPGSRDVVSRWRPDVRPLESLQHTMCEYAGQPLVVRRLDLLGTAGYLLSTDRAKLVDLWNDLLSAGGTPCGAEAFHAARIAAGFPLYGLDLTENNLAQEAARTEHAISFNKGCYLGQEPISRIDSRGHINRELCRLRIDADIVPDHDAAVISVEGQQLGVVTSAARIPGESHSVALACVRTSHSRSETQVTVLGNGIPLVARVW